mgnify:CR=1 FL=1
MWETSLTVSPHTVAHHAVTVSHYAVRSIHMSHTLYGSHHRVVCTREHRHFGKVILHVGEVFIRLCLC